MARKTETKKQSNNITLKGENTVIDIRPFEKDNILGFATLTLYGFIKFYNCKVIKGKESVFLAMPSYKGSDDKYYSYSYIDSRDKDGRFVTDEIDALLDDHYNG